MKKLMFILTSSLLIPFVIGCASTRYHQNYPTGAQTPRHKMNYVEDLHGAPAKFGVFVFDVDSKNKSNWTSYEYFISCKHSRTKPQFPFMKYDRGRDLLTKFNIHTGKMQSAMFEKDNKNSYPLYLIQPRCERGIEPVL